MSALDEGVLSLSSVIFAEDREDRQPWLLDREDPELALLHQMPENSPRKRRERPFVGLRPLLIHRWTFKALFRSASAKMLRAPPWPEVRRGDRESEAIEMGDGSAPTRPKVKPDPLKAPRRPLLRQNTAALMQKLSTQPSLFGDVPASAARLADEGILVRRRWGDLDLLSLAPRSSDSGRNLALSLLCSLPAVLAFLNRQVHLLPSLKSAVQSLHRHPHS
jgi:hypothetical protein